MYGEGTLNGALWTITVVIQFYVVAWFMIKALRNNWRAWIATLMVSVLISLLINLFESALPEILFKLIRNFFVPYLWLFISGGFMSCFADRLLPMSKRWWLVFLGLGAALISLNIDVYGVYYGVCRIPLSMWRVNSICISFPEV